LEAWSKYATGVPREEGEGTEGKRKDADCGICDSAARVALLRFFFFFYNLV
jgi:hypothetical protein